MSSVRGIRGAIKVKNNTKEEISAATRELLDLLLTANQVHTEDIASVFFTVSPDLDAEFPACATRDFGWQMVPLMCAREIDVPGSMAGVIRILLQVNTDLTQQQIKHQYVGETARLRPDLQGGNS